MNDLARFLIRSPKQVVSYLKLLSSERCLISAAFGSSEKDTFLTAIMDIDEKNQTSTIDCGPKEYLNKKLLDSAIIKCSTEYKGIKVLFEGRKVKKSGTPGQPSFTIPIPSSLYWVQRRQFYRVKSPLSKDSYCELSLTNQETGEQTTANLKINDISASGVSFLNEDKELSTLFEPTTELNHCSLVLDNQATLSVELEVRHKLSHNPNNPGKTERIGCYITNSTPRIESTILRSPYVSIPVACKI